MTDKTLFEKIKIFYKYHISKRPALGPIQEKDLGLIPLEFDLEQYYSELMSFSNDFNITEIENITFKGNRYPVLSINFNKSIKKKKLFITAGIHGNETAGLLAILSILKDIKRNRGLYSNINIMFIAPVNPVGVLKFSRYNALGYDINRDFYVEITDFELNGDCEKNGYPVLIPNLYGLFLFKFLDIHLYITLLFLPLIHSLISIGACNISVNLFKYVFLTTFLSIELITSFLIISYLFLFISLFLYLSST